MPQTPQALTHTPEARVMKVITYHHVPRCIPDIFEEGKNMNTSVFEGLELNQF